MPERPVYTIEYQSTLDPHPRTFQVEAWTKASAERLFWVWVGLRNIMGHTQVLSVTQNLGE